MRLNEAGQVHGLMHISMALVLTTGAWAADVPPEGLVIESVDVAGNVTLSRSEVLSVVRVRAGQVFNAETVSEDAKLLGKLEGVERAYENVRI